MLTYPATDFQKLQPLLTAMGSFWSDLVSDPTTIDFLQARLRQNMQTYLNYVETVACLGRNTCPVFHKEYWAGLTLYKSKLGKSNASSVKYGDGTKYGDLYLYGGYHEDVISISCDATLVSATIVTDNILTPTITWVNGTDFYVDAEHDSLVFVENPFEYIASQPVYDETGAEVDQVITLWLCNALFDRQDLYRTWGYLLNAPSDSSEFYKGFINASFDAITGVASAYDITRILSAVAGVSLAIGNETVEDIKSLPEKLVIVTDKNAYSFLPTANAVVSIGDKLSPGDTLVDTLKIVEVMTEADLDAVTAAPLDWPGIALGSEFITGEFFNVLGFKNANVPVTWRLISPHDIRFEITGWPADVELFWQYVANSGSTLVSALGSAPETINPMRLLLANFFKGNIVLARIKVDACGGLGVAAVNMIRQHLPPHVNLMVFSVLNPSQDTYEKSKISESVAASDLIPSAETFDKGNISESVNCWLIEGCV